MLKLLAFIRPCLPHFSSTATTIVSSRCHPFLLKMSETVSLPVKIAATI